jgi:hypothetical protein
MNTQRIGWRWPALGSRWPLSGIVATLLVVSGLLLGVTVHMGFMILFAAGAFGPGVLRQLGLLDDLDELQKDAAAKSGLRAYLVTGILLMAVVVADNWHRLSIGGERIPAAPAVIVMLVVYYASYCLSFWDARKAVSLVLLTFGVLWLVFVALSHAGEPLALVGESLIVAGPFILGAILCRRWPKTIGLLLLAASMWSIHFFNMLPRSAARSEDVLKNSFTFMLIPLPLTIAGVALLTDRRPIRSEENG